MARVSPLLFSLCISLACTGCHQGPPPPQSTVAQPADPPMKAAPPTPLQEKKQELGFSKTWDPQWDAVVEKSLPADLLSGRAARAVHPWCPRFAEETEADKRAFWAYTFQALAGAEAGLNPTADVHHTQRVLAHIDTVTRRPIRQEGLLQLTYQDAQRYGCDFNWPHDRRLPERSPERSILQPEQNLSCGIRIMDNQIIQQGKPLVSHTSYWSTLQPGTVSYRVFARQMANVPAACGLHERTPRAAHLRRVRTRAR